MWAAGFCMLLGAGLDDLSLLTEGAAEGSRREVRGVIPCSNAKAAARPAASPMAKQVGMMRRAAWPSWVDETHRPATRRLERATGSRQR